MNKILSNAEVEEITIITGVYDQDLKQSYVCEFVNGLGIRAYIKDGTAPSVLQKAWLSIPERFPNCKKIYTRQLNLFTEEYRKKLSGIEMIKDTNDDLNFIMKQFAWKLSDKRTHIRSW